MASQASIDNANKKILQALSDYNAAYPGDISHYLREIANHAGYSGVEGKAFRGAIQKMKSEGILTRKKDIITVTTKGLESLPPPKSPPSETNRLEQLLKMICNDTGKIQGGLPNKDKIQAVFEVLLDGKEHSKEELAQKAGYKATDTKKFRNLMKRFVTVKLADSSSGKRLRLNETAFGRAGHATRAKTTNQEGRKESSDAKEEVNEPLNKKLKKSNECKSEISKKTGESTDDVVKKKGSMDEKEEKEEQDLNTKRKVPKEKVKGTRKGAKKTEEASLVSGDTETGHLRRKAIKPSTKRTRKR
ncbi:hypothetical protein IV203_020934 [Nitzschia inconspicua]|uniref:Uncharacterized protein n=1 Tax=Nitzschia inconspicua TaxID=303405 RepID=A0A9K3PFI7_9STRA|nr:hypothetical protein IV203_020934 [Nitzschia inconspicua]